MSKSILYRLRATIISPAMLISVLLGLVVLLKFHIIHYFWYCAEYGAISFSEMGGSYLNEISFMHSVSGFDLFAPILAVLPATTLFCEDYNSGYIKSILGRTEKRRYITETIFCSSIAGGLAMFIPTLISNALMVICFQPNSVGIKLGYEDFLDEGIFANIQYVWGGLVVVIILTVLSFLFGAVWSNIGLCISAFIPNKYIALAFPFVLYFSSHLILYRLGESALLFSPVNMIMPNAAVIPSLSYPFVYQGVLLLLTVWLFKQAVQRRLQDV